VTKDISNAMKTLTINNRTFQYEIFEDSTEWGTYQYTEFYDGTITVTRKKYWLFGEKNTKTIPNHVFTIYNDIEDKTYTKKQVRGWIERQVELLDREEEIERGEII
jgi:hypothetical protein